MTLKTLFSTLLALLLTLVTAVALAEQDYQPYKPGGKGEEVSAPLFVVLAYSLIWLLLLVFVASVWRRQRRLEAELAQFQRQLEGGGK